MNLCDNTGLVLEGGGFRAIFVAGVLEAMQQHELLFPYAVGVSAGAAYAVSYVSRQAGRNLQTNACINHPEYCGMHHLIKNGDFFNWEYIYKTIPTQIIPLDYQALASSSTRFQMVLTNCETIQPEYIDANSTSPEIVRDLLTATSSLPYVSKMKLIEQTLYLDGGLTDPIPVQHALTQGNNRLVVVLTRPKDYLKKPSKTAFLNKIFYRKYPKVANTLTTRVDKYNQTIREIEALEAAGKVFVIRPTTAIPIGRMENDPKSLEKVYVDTLSKMEPVMEDLKKWLEKF